MKRILIGLCVALALVLVGGAWFLHASGQRAPGQYFDSNGVKIFYTDEGPRDAEPVVLIHGFAVNADLNWRKPGIVDKLKKDYRVITFDNRGHGLSDKPHEPEKYGIEMVNDVIRLIDHLKIAKTNVIGYSMGGFITMRLIASYPDRLICAMPCGAGWSKAEGENEKLLQTLADSLDAGGGFDALARRLQPGGKEPGAFRMASMNFFLSRINDKKALAAVIRGFRSLVVEEAELRVNPVPVEAVVGSIDPLRDGVDNMKDVMNNLKTVYIDGDNHVNTPPDPRYIATIRDFLAAHNGRNKPTTAQAAPLSISATASKPVLAGS